MADELEQKIVDLQNQINDLKYNLFKNEFSNTTIITKEISQLTNGYQSANFVTGSTGWRFDSAGNLEANAGTFRGSITGATGIFSGSVSIGSGNDIFKADSNGIYLGNATFASAPFRVTMGGVLTATDITATGTVNATGGYIGASTALAFESTGINCGTTGHVRGGQTDYNTGTGFFLGYSGAAYKLSLGVSTGNYLTWDGSVLTIGGVINHLAGDILYQSADTVRSEGGSAYVKHKEITIKRPGTYRIKFSIASTDASASAFGKIYRNGSAVGTERSTASGSPVEFSEDISGWSANDAIQIYTKFTGTGGQNCSLTNFRIYVLDYDSSSVTYDS